MANDLAKPHLHFLKYVLVICSSLTTVSSIGSENEEYRYPLLPTGEAKDARHSSQGLAPTIETDGTKSVTMDSAFLNGTITPNSPNTRYSFLWGDSPSYDKATPELPARVANSAFSFDHPLGGLECNTTYYFQAVARTDDETVFGQGRSFTTAPCPESAPSVVTEQANPVTQTGARLKGTADPNSASTSAWFEWGKNSFDQTTSVVDAGKEDSPEAYNRQLSGLDCNSTYRYRAVAENSAGIQRGGVRTFSTEKCSPAPSIPIDADLGDAWFNPETTGQGFFMTVYPKQGLMFVAWFTFDTSRPTGGTPVDLGYAGHRWVTAFGSYSGNVAVLSIEVTEGGLFDSGKQTSQHADGTLTLRFEGCDRAIVSYNIPSIGESGEFPVQRVATDNVERCQSRVSEESQVLVNHEEAQPYSVDAKSRTASSAYDTAIVELSSSGTKAARLSVRQQSFPDISPYMIDAWYNLATLGQGFFFTVLPEAQLVFVAWFTYDTFRPDEDEWHEFGEPGHRWITAFGPYAGNEAILDLEITKGGVFDSNKAVNQEVIEGSLSLFFEDCNNAIVGYDIPSIDRRGEFPVQRIAGDNLALCEFYSGVKPPKSGATFGSTTDANDDSPESDILKASIYFDGDQTVTFNAVFNPEKFEPGSTWAWFSLDTDQNKNSGYRGLDSICQVDGAQIGLEYFVSLSNSGANIYRANGGCGDGFTTTHQGIEVQQSPSGFEVSIPAGWIEDDDGLMDFKAIGATGFWLYDILPDLGKSSTGTRLLSEQ
jgi:hypothetical protein